MNERQNEKLDISDLYIPVKGFRKDNNQGAVVDQNSLDGAWFFTTGSKTTHKVKETPEVQEFGANVLYALNKGSEQCISSDDVNDVRLEVPMTDGSKTFCRVHKEGGTSYGTTLSIRVQPEVPPLLEEMALPMGAYDLLMHSSLEKGGLVIVVAGLGAGKTTTVSGTVISRLTRFGGQAVSIEDPPEHNLMGFNEGYWGKGKIIQKAVLSSRGEKFSDAVRASLRMFPATPGNLLFLGEIRDSDTAEHALNAATNGSLVVATVHGSDLASGLDRFISYTIKNLGKELAYNMLRDCLRISMSQSLRKLRDGGGQGDWGGYAPKVSMLHNLFWKGELNEAISGGFDPELGVKKGLQNIISIQRRNMESASYALNLIMKGVVKGRSADDVMRSLKEDDSEKKPSQFGIQLQDIMPVYDQIAGEPLTTQQKKRLIRPGVEWQNNYEPSSCIDLRKKVIGLMLDNYYRD
jgi:Tfp pilus assembly pilus retraction ATPase PilT